MPKPAPVVLRGTVTKLTGRKPHVEVPDLGGVGYDFGPCETATGQAVKKGDRVLVVTVGGITDDVVVVGILDDEDQYERLDRRYYRKGEVDDLLDALEARINQKLSGKADVGHTHNF